LPGSGVADAVRAIDEANSAVQIAVAIRPLAMAAA
jgi:hypothetical protein